MRSIIIQENDKETIDLVVIDYLTMLSTPDARDDVADKTAIAKDCKRLTLTLNKGRGVCILTPIQGNRKGYTEAAENDGAWSTTGIFQYSELDKSFDNIFYIYFDDGLNREKKVRIGSCKTRREANIPSTMVEIDQGSGAHRWPARSRGQIRRGHSGGDRTEHAVDERVARAPCEVPRRDQPFACGADGSAPAGLPRRGLLMSKPPCWYNYDLAHQLKWIAPRLDISAKGMAVLQSYVTEFHDDTQESWVDQTLMATRIKLSTETIRCATRELEEKKLIQFVRYKKRAAPSASTKSRCPRPSSRYLSASAATLKREPRPAQTMKNRSVI